MQNANGLGLRYYQIDAIKAVENKIINNPDDKRSLLVMATGTGKQNNNWFSLSLDKNQTDLKIIILNDRRLLASEALGSFKDTIKVEIDKLCCLQNGRNGKCFPESENAFAFCYRSKHGEKIILL